MANQPLNPHLSALAEQHRLWLSKFHPQYLANWNKLLGSDQYAALYEAAVRNKLADYCDSIEPSEQLTGKYRGPDFRCTKRGSHFYVEATCISIEKAEEKTGVPADSTGIFPWSPFGLIESVFSKCDWKYGQLRNLDGPALLAVGTFHPFAAMDLKDKVVVGHVLTGKTMMAWNVNPHTGNDGNTFQLTEFEDSAFLQFDKSNGVAFANSPISGILLGGITQPFLGVLHPNAKHPFNPAQLSGIEFGSVSIDHTIRQLQVSWAIA